jgi:quercetin dioxygenase-like cupin family protein
MPIGISEQFAHLVGPDLSVTIDVLGPTIQFVTSPADAGAPCVMLGTIPPGVSIPLHSHGDPETFVMLSGSVEGLVYRTEGFEWVRLRPGDVFHVPPYAKHAWRNTGQTRAEMTLISTSRMGRFLQELGKPVRFGVPPEPPTPDEIARFQAIAERYGYWNATPEDNARVGITMPQAAP